jgi:hypothetical protein
MLRTVSCAPPPLPHSYSVAVFYTFPGERIDPGLGADWAVGGQVWEQLVCRRTFPLLAEGREGLVPHSCLEAVQQSLACYLPTLLLPSGSESLEVGAAGRSESHFFVGLLWDEAGFSSQFAHKITGT